MLELPESSIELLGSVHADQEDDDEELELGDMGRSKRNKKKHKDKHLGGSGIK